MRFEFARSRFPIIIGIGIGCGGLVLVLVMSEMLACLTAFMHAIGARNSPSQLEHECNGQESDKSNHDVIIAQPSHTHLLPVCSIGKGKSSRVKHS